MASTPSRQVIPSRKYAGDTRLQMLISYAVSGDARQAIGAFAESHSQGGLQPGAST